MITLHNGDNLEYLSTLEDNSIDAIVTDPPYGLGKEPDPYEVLQSWLDTGYHEISGGGFMGKEWDSFIPQPKFWKEIYRVLKPGGHLLVFSGTRTHDWMNMSMRLAGFKIKDMITWNFSSGMPKGLSIEKAIDKYYGKERKVIGKKVSTYDGANRDPNKHKTIQETAIESHHWGYKDKSHGLMETEPATDLAKEYRGWNTQLKPAIEPITLAMKPFSETNTVENIIKHGVGGMNIDECRVGEREREQFTGKKEGSVNTYGNYFYEKSTEPLPSGRYPSNFIHDGSDEVIELFPYTKSGKMTSDSKRSTDGSPAGIFGKININTPLLDTFGDEGSAARFFYCAKASRKERDLGLETFNKKQVGTYVQDEYSIKSMGNTPDIERNPVANIHVSVKPLKLMEYLVKLITNENMIVLDPFMGSGTTGIACKNLNRKFIGVELDDEYFNIAKARIDTAHLHLQTKKTKTKKQKQNIDFSNFY